MRAAQKTARRPIKTPWRAAEGRVAGLVYAATVIALQSLCAGLGARTQPSSHPHLDFPQEYAILTPTYAYREVCVVTLDY